MPAIPPKHPQYTFGETFSGLSTFDLVDDTLYILYTGNDDAALGPRQLLRSFDLRSEDSKHEWAGLNRMERTTARDASCDTWVDGDAYVICGDTPELLDRNTFEVLYSERDGLLQEGWDDYSWIHYWGGVVYRFVDLGNPGSGIDVVSLQGGTPKVVEHLDVDIDPSGTGHGQYIAGLREGGGAAVYALGERRYVFEAAEDGVHYRHGRQTNGVAFEGGRVFFLLGDTLLVGSLATGEVLHRINYLALPRFQQYLQEHGREEQASFAAEMAVLGDKVFLGGTWLRGYLLCIDLALGDAAWLRASAHQIETLTARGDLVYGLDTLVPTAWDIHTGEPAWQSEQSIRGHRVQINDRWLVIAGSKGDTHCYPLKTPYLTKQSG